MTRSLISALAVELLILNARTEPSRLRLASSGNVEKRGEWVANEMLYTSCKEIMHSRTPLSLEPITAYIILSVKASKDPSKRIAEPEHW